MSISISTRERQRNEYKHLKTIIKGILCAIKDNYAVWFQSRLKSEESINEKISVRQKELNDIIGFRLIYQWTDGLYELSDILREYKELNIFEIKSSEKYKVIHMYGKTKSNDVYEIQLWPTFIYTCFEYEHNKIYKPINKPTEKQLENSLKIRELEHQIQDIIDNNRLVPYNS